MMYFSNNDETPTKKGNKAKAKITNYAVFCKIY